MHTAKISLKVSLPKLLWTCHCHYLWDQPLPETCQKKWINKKTSCPPRVTAPRASNYTQRKIEVIHAQVIFWCEYYHSNNCNIKRHILTCPGISRFNGSKGPIVKEPSPHISVLKQHTRHLIFVKILNQT